MWRMSGQRPGESREADRQSLPLIGSQRPQQLLMVGPQVLADAVSELRPSGVS